MRKEFPTLEDYSALLGAADRIKAIEPWKYFWDIDLAEITADEDEQTYYCSIMGHCNEKPSIMIYEGEKGLVDFYRYLNAQTLPEFMVDLYQNAIVCSWATEDMISGKDSVIIRVAGRDYDKDEELPFFRKYEMGFLPELLIKQDAIKTANVLTALADALEELKADGRLEQIRDDSRIDRYFDKGSGKWYTEIIGPVGEIEAVTDGCRITDEVLLRRLMKKKKNGAHLEFDVVYVPIPVEDSRIGRPFFPQMAMLCDVLRGNVVAQYPLEPGEDRRGIAIGLLTSYIEQNGRPQVVYIRDEEMMGVVAHLCQSVGVSVIISSPLEVLDGELTRLVKSMMISYPVGGE